MVYRVDKRCHPGERAVVLPLRSRVKIAVNKYFTCATPNNIFLIYRAIKKTEAPLLFWRPLTIIYL